MESILQMINGLDMAAITTVIAHVVALAAAISAMTPTPRDDHFVANFVKILNVIGLNVGHAKNESK